MYVYVCVVCGVCGVRCARYVRYVHSFWCRKKAKVNGVCFDIFRNEKNAPSTLHFSEVYHGPIPGGVFGFFQIEYPEVFFLRFTRVP
jgi:hypothetical protein